MGIHETGRPNVRRAENSSGMQISIKGDSRLGHSIRRRAGFDRLVLSNSRHAPSRAIYQPHRNRKGWRYADPFVQGGNNIPYATPEAATNNGASRLSMINAAITIIYRPKTMFHGVSTPMAGRLGWTVSFGLSYPSLHTRVESAVSTFSLPLPPPSPIHATRPDLCKNLGMSPWGAATRLINRGHTTHRILHVHYVLSTF